MRGLLAAAALMAYLAGCVQAKKPADDTNRSSAPPSRQALPENLLQVKRIYVAPLGGGPGAEALRDLIISSLNATTLFALTDNKSRADAILKGSAADHTYVETHDMVDGANGRGGVRLSHGGSGYSGTSLSANQSGSAREGHHSKEIKHDAFAALRLCNRDGDVIWSTTQESGDGKFQGASEEVASKVARQILEDFESEQRAETANAGTPRPVN
ncbi:MAG TPA: hypothetical protein VF283_08900 [Bryobacteraceae bacterium]